VLALQSGDDVKNVQENLGHYSAAFTLDTYAHTTEKMKRDSADRMEGYIRDILKL
jgi:integrase